MLPFKDFLGTSCGYAELLCWGETLEMFLGDLPTPTTSASHGRPGPCPVREVPARRRGERVLWECRELRFPGGDARRWDTAGTLPPAQLHALLLWAAPPRPGGCGTGLDSERERAIPPLSTLGDAVHIPSAQGESREGLLGEPKRCHGSSLPVPPLRHNPQLTPSAFSSLGVPVTQSWENCVSESH